MNTSAPTSAPTSAATPLATLPSGESGVADGIVRMIANLPYTGDAFASLRQRLDLYLPEQAAGRERFPMLCFVHGGALMMGDKSLVRSLGMCCARNGIAVAAFNHRLSPAVTHPAHIEDIAAAIAWVADNIGRHGGDATRIGIAGHSSGAYLAALLASDHRYLQRHGFDANRLRAVVPISGFFHVERLAPERPKHVWGEDSVGWTDASPATHLRSPHPPTLLLYADGDDEARRKESLDYGARLRDVNVVLEVQQIASRDHRSIFSRMTRPDDPAMHAMLRFLREHLVG